MSSILKWQNWLITSKKKLLNILWETWEQVHALDALIQIDTSEAYFEQRRQCFDSIYELRSVLRQKWLPELPPLAPLLIRHQNMKIFYSPRLHNRMSYFRFLTSKRRVLDRHKQIIDRHDNLRRQRRRQVTMVTRGCLRW